MLVVSKGQPYESRPVSLVFTTGNDWFQTLIELHTGSSATHVAIGIGNQLLHSHEDGVVLEPRSYWFGKRKQKLIAEFQILVDVDDGIRGVLRHVGKGFGVAHVLKAGLLRKLTPWVRSLGPDSTDRLSCTQLVAMIDPHGEHIPEWRYLWREGLAPVDLLEVAAWSPRFRRIA